MEDFEISRLKMASADHEYSIKIPKECTHIKIQCTDGTAVRMSTKKDVVAGNNKPIWTLKAAVTNGENSQVFEIKNMRLKKDKLLYVACGSANKNLEIFMGFNETHTLKPTVDTPYSTATSTLKR